LPPKCGGYSNVRFPNFAAQKRSDSNPPHHNMAAISADRQLSGNCPADPNDRFGGAKPTFD